MIIKIYSPGQDVRLSDFYFSAVVVLDRSVEIIAVLFYELKRSGDGRENRKYQ
jgi:hypothetical protein